MTVPRFIEIDGKPYLWRDLLRLRKEQRTSARTAEQPALFELREDHRPVFDRTAAGRYLEPSLFTFAAAPAGLSSSNLNLNRQERPTV